MLRKMELCRYPAHYLHILRLRREMCSREITASVFERIARLEPCLNAYITLLNERALEQEQAAQADRMVARGERSSP